VLSTPPAFVLSQDQTLHKGHTTNPPQTERTGQTSRIQTQQKQPTHPTKREGRSSSASKKPTPHPHRRTRHKQSTGQTPQQKKGHLYKALAFNTLLSSQETDTHHQEPHQVPSGATLLTYQNPSPCQPDQTTPEPTRDQNPAPTPPTTTPEHTTHTRKQSRRESHGPATTASCIPYRATTPSSHRPHTAQSTRIRSQPQGRPPHSVPHPLGA
jgi:hypothetical protein